MARQPCTFVVEAHNAAGERCKTGGDHFKVVMHGVSLVRVRVRDREDGRYVCEYCAPTSGQYTIAISLHGVPIRGSPFTTNVLRPQPSAARCLL